MTGDEVQRLLGSLARRAQGTSAGDPQVVETHISWVLLFGDEALKIKKPVDLGFLDFSTLQRRRHFCEEEFRINSRTAPRIYRGVVTLRGTPESPRLSDHSASKTGNNLGEAFEYAVRMGRFDQKDLLLHVLERGELTRDHVDDFAETLAGLHEEQAAVASPDAEFGSPESVRRPVDANFDVLEFLVDDEEHRTRFERLRDWSESEFERQREVFAERKRNGWVRECHGDAHLGNAILERSAGRERVVLFDAIEFEPGLRWIDVVSDAAFTAMDLADHGRTDLSHRFRNAYLERTADHGGLAVLPFYLVYRSLVRAKVAAIRRSQPDVSPDVRVACTREIAGYLDLAERYTRPRRPRLLLTCGVSGSGKSTLAEGLVETFGAIRIRSDVERKRLAGIAPDETADPATLYAPAMSERTYDRLRDLARTIVRAGFMAVVDATFLERARRDSFRELASELDVSLVFVHATASADVLRERVAARTRRGDDPSDAGIAVLEGQLANREPPGPDESEGAEWIDVDTGREDAWGRLFARLETGSSEVATRRRETEESRS